MCDGHVTLINGANIVFITLPCMQGQGVILAAFCVTTILLILPWEGKKAANAGTTGVPFFLLIDLTKCSSLGPT